jgi:hypothetical protein
MNKNSLIHMFCLIFVGLLLVACGAQPPTEEPDRIATRVAEEKAVAATLTADALLSQPPPTSTPVPPTATAIPPTDTPIPPTATSKNRLRTHLCQQTRPRRRPQTRHHRHLRLPLPRY